MALDIKGTELEKNSVLQWVLQKKLLFVAGLLTGKMCFFHSMKKLCNLSEVSVEKT